MVLYKLTDTYLVTLCPSVSGYLLPFELFAQNPVMLGGKHILHH